MNERSENRTRGRFSSILTEDVRTVIKASLAVGKSRIKRSPGIIRATLTNERQWQDELGDGGEGGAGQSAGQGGGLPTDVIAHGPVQTLQNGGSS